MVNYSYDHKMLGLHSGFLRYSFAHIFLALRDGRAIRCGNLHKIAEFSFSPPWICPRTAIRQFTSHYSPDFDYSAIKTYGNLHPRLNCSPEALRRFPQ